MHEQRIFSRDATKFLWRYTSVLRCSLSQRMNRMRRMLTMATNGLLEAQLDQVQ